VCLRRVGQGARACGRERAKWWIYKVLTLPHEVVSSSGAAGIAGYPFQGFDDYPFQEFGDTHGWIFMLMLVLVLGQL
jgi:hypothetical protein